MLARKIQSVVRWRRIARHEREGAGRIRITFVVAVVFTPRGIRTSWSSVPTIVVVPLRKNEEEGKQWEGRKKRKKSECEVRSFRVQILYVNVCSFVFTYVPGLRCE